MIRVAICDDEQYMLDKMTVMVSDFFHQNHHFDHVEYSHLEAELTQFSSGEALLRSDKTFDILFLDIQMNNMDGMETARKLRSQGFKGYLIFITVLQEMVFRAFEVQAYDYLVKPIEKKHFEKTMKRLFVSI